MTPYPGSAPGELPATVPRLPQIMSVVYPNLLTRTEQRLPSVVGASMIFLLVHALKTADYNFPSTPTNFRS